MKSNNDFDAILDKTTAGIRNENVDATVVNDAAERVWARVAAEAGDQVAVPATLAADRIESCADFQSLIPAYLKGSLSEARSLLLVDHTHECIPCRKAMKDARARNLAPARRAVAPKRYSLQPVILRWGVAAALVIGVGLLALPFIQRLPFGGNLEATVQAAEGQVYQIEDTRSAPIVVGGKVEKGDRIRTAKDSHAVISLGDGSTIEMKDRSEFYITKTVQGTTIHLNRGAIVVEAAKQRNQQLFVKTPDAHVSVTGTIFSVNSGTKGSRVSVVEGEVNLEHGGNERVLRAGDQLATSKSIEKVAVSDELAWSKNAGRYAEMLAAFSGLNKELSKVQRPGLRNSTRLLDLMPENTIVYAALPNLTTTIVESHRIMSQRINQNAALKQWWEKEQAGKHRVNVDQIISTIQDFNNYLGDEVAVSLSMDQKGEPTAPLVLAELKNSNGFREFLQQQIARYSGDTQKRPNLRFVDDPSHAVASTTTAGEKEIFIWIQNDLFAATPEVKNLQRLAAVSRQSEANGFASDAFRNRIAQVYSEGAGLIVAANLERIVAQTQQVRSKGQDGGRHEEALNKLGVLSVKYLVLDQNESAGKTHTKASLSFNDPQRGLPSWLAAPAPMGSLEYISPDANVVAGFVVKDPVRLVDDLLAAVEIVSPDLRKNLDKQQADHGVNIRNDIAAPLGGEFAFTIDGPILPTPSWKMIFEVNDSAHLQQTLERVVAEINKEAAKFGKGGLIWERSELGGRSYYALRSRDFGVEVNYAYVNGYLVMGPSRALVERAIRSQESGYTLLRSSRFTAGLPADGKPNFSALFYHNLAPLVQPFAEKIANSATNLPQEQQQAIKSMAAELPPTLAYAYAHGDSITFAANTEGGPFGLSPASLLGMPHALEIQHILQQGMKTK